MFSQWDNQYWEDEAEYRQAEELHREYNPDTPSDIDIMEWY